jgi:hypothetical protein
LLAELGRYCAKSLMFLMWCKNCFAEGDHCHEADVENAMSKILKTPWFAHGKPLIKRMDRWVSLRNPQAGVGQECDWLGWDGWVRTESDPLGRGDNTNAR